MSKKFTTGEEEDTYRYPLNEDLYAGLKNAVNTNRPALALEYVRRLVISHADEIYELKQALAELSSKLESKPVAKPKAAAAAKEADESE